MRQPNTSAQRVQVPTPADCRHSKRAFDQGYHDVVHRKDLTPVARVLHPFLVTLHRTEYAHDRYPTQLQIAASVGLTRHQVWSGLRELVQAGLIISVRPGLGMPNYYLLISDEDGEIEHPSGPETARRPVRERHSGRSGNLARAGTYSRKRTDGRMEYGTKDYFATSCLRCGSRLHATREHGPTPAR